MPNDADRAGTPAGVFGAELRFYRTRAGLSQKDLAARATVSHDVIRLSAWSMIAAATGTVGSATARYTARAAARQWL